MSQIPDNGPIKDIMVECARSTKACAQVLFPDRFGRAFSPYHDEMFRLIDDPSLKKVVIAAPRGSGKTTLVDLALTAKSLLFQQKRFIVMVSCSSTLAELQSNNLKIELQSNKMVKKLFGEIKPGSRDVPFSKEMWGTEWDSVVLPRGRGQQIRGLNYLGYRPDMIIIDDLEETEEVMSEDQRKKASVWFHSDLLNSVDLGGDFKIVYIGTVLHQDSLLQNLLEDPKWASLRLSLCDDQYNSLWPSYISTFQVKEMVDDHRKNGILDIFYREFMNLPVASEDAIFRGEYFKYYDTEKQDFHGMESVVIIDPAKTVKITSAESAIIGLTFDKRISKIFVRDLVAARLHPEEIYSEAFAMADRIGARVIGLEVTSLNEFITYPMQDAMLRRGRFYELVELKARAKKEDRIKMLVPFYRQGLLWHNSSCCGPLEAQLLSFPASKRFDCMDALAYIVEMLDIGGRFASSWGGTDEEIEKEYEDLERLDDEEEFSELGAWRTA